MKTKTILTVALALLFGALSFTPAHAAAPDPQTVADAYVYLLGRALVIRQEHNDLKEKGVAYNVIKYNPLGSADFVNPNLDVAYLEAWIAVDDKSPALLEVPEVKGRYYTAQILDEWGEVIVNINERTFPSHPSGKFLFVLPGSKVKTPEGASRIELHSGKAKMLARVELKDDREGAVKLQHEFKLTALGQPTIIQPPAIADFNNKDLIGVEIFDDFETKLSSALDVAPTAAELQQKVRAVAAYAATSAEARATIDKQLHAKVIPEFIEYALTKSAPYRNNWVGGAAAGNYGTDYYRRTTINLLGIWANGIGEATYYVASRDADGQPLDGSKSYVIHFPADKLPGSVVKGYWSIILVGVPDYRPVSNPLKRFNFNSYSPLKSDPDGSLKIAIGPKPVPGVAESNWLPSADGKPFSLTLRTYVPGEAVRNGEWSPAAVTLVK